MVLTAKPPVEGSSSKQSEPPTTETESSNSAQSAVEENTASAPLLNQLKLEAKQAISQAVSDYKTESKEHWSEKYHDFINGGLLLTFCAVHLVPGISHTWKAVVQGTYYAATEPFKVTSETVNTLAPEMSEPVEEGDIIDGCWIVTSGIKEKRTINGVTRPHRGVDFAPGANCQGEAAKRLHMVGEVGDTMRTSCQATAESGGYGNFVKVENVTQGFILEYGHLEKFSTGSEPCKEEEFQYGSRDTFLGLMGTTGRSTGIHLHLQMRDPKTGELKTAIPMWAAYGVFGKKYDPLIQRGEKSVQ